MRTRQPPRKPREKTAEKTRQKSRERILWIALVLVTWMIAVVWRLSWLQVVRHDYYLEKAAHNQQKEIETTPARGAILDRDGKELAYSVITDSLFADPKLLKDEDRRRLTARMLAPLLEVDEGDLLRRLSVDSSFVWIKRKISLETSDAVKQAIIDHKLIGLSFKQETQRFYPNDSLAAHLVGYVGLDDQGQAGLEQSMDSHLRGIPGEIAIMKDASGRPFERSEIPAMTGARMFTTIDAGLQHKVEILLDDVVKLSRAKGAYAIVMDPSNGEILVLANAPSFNPNERPKTSNDPARHNRLISFPYEPGSVFKLVTYAAAFEEGLVTPEDKVNCGNGEITFGKRVIHDTHPYGVLSVADAFAKSSNVGAIRLAQKVGKERLYDYILRFGFGRRTGIELPGESKGIVNPLTAWRPDSIGSVAIGQEVSVTLLQAVAAMAAVANQGVWVQPHVLKTIASPDGRTIFETKPETRQVISAKTAKQMSEILQRVVTQGTARHAVRLEGYTAAGKTGTPQKVDALTRTYSKTKYMPSFAGFVPATNPRFAIMVMIDEPVGLYYGASVAAPVFNQIAEVALGDLVVPPDDQGFHDSMVKLAKRYESETSKDAAQTAQAPAPTDQDLSRDSAGVEVETKKADQAARPAKGRSGGQVFGNLPPSAAGSAPARPAPALRESVEQVAAYGVMPDFRGRGLRAVIQACRELNLNVRFYGSGVAVKQMPAPGARVRPGDECRVEFH